MKKILICLMIVFMFSMLVLAKEELGDFGWLLSQEELIEEKGEDYRKENYDSGDVVVKYFDVEILDKDFRVEYLITDDEGLIKLNYVYTEDHDGLVELNKYVDVFNEIKDVLEEKHGEPKDSTFWFNKSLKDKPDLHGMAIARGDVHKRFIWRTEESRISLNATNTELMGVKVYINYLRRDEQK